MSEPTGAAERAPPLSDALPRLEDAIDRVEGLLLCLDFDGTLAHIVEEPTDAEPLPGVQSALSTLADRPDVEVAVVSGRALSDLRGRLDVDGLTYAGNHGLERWRDGVRTPHPEAENRRAAVRSAAETVDARLADVPGTAVEDKGLTATVHYRGADEEGADAARAAARSAALAEDLDYSAGKAIVEIRPAVGWDKGDVVRELRPPGEERLVVYVGDDTTDEDGFDALGERGVGVHVGDGRGTAADYRLSDPDAVAAFLDWLVELTGDGRAPELSG